MIWEAASPETHKPKIVNESLGVFTLYLLKMGSNDPFYIKLSLKNFLLTKGSFGKDVGHLLY